MELLTKELKEIFKKYPLYSQDGLGGNAKVIVKYFNPGGAGTWFITEGDELENGDYELFGYCHLGDDDNAELGYILLSQLEEIRLPLGLTIERDLHFKQFTTLKEALESEGFRVPSYWLEEADDEENEEG